MAAHVLLVNRVQRRVWKLPGRTDGPFTFDFDGMRVDFATLDRPHGGVSPGGLVDVYIPRWHVDPAQFGASHQWHARLDRRVGGIAYGHAARATAVLPAVWLAVALAGTASAGTDAAGASAGLRL